MISTITQVLPQSGPYVIRQKRPASTKRVNMSISTKETNFTSSETTKSRAMRTGKNNDGKEYSRKCIRLLREYICYFDEEGVPRIAYRFFYSLRFK